MRVVDGIFVPHIEADVMHMAYMLDPTKGAFGYKLKPLSQEHTSLGAYDTEVKSDEDDPDMWAKVPLITLGTYNIADCDATLRLYNLFLKQIKELGMSAVMRLMAQGLFPLMEMEINGLYIDRDLINQYIPKLEALLVKYEEELVMYAGKKIDWNSPAELAKLFYDDLGYKDPYGRGDRGTEENVMEIFNTDLSNAVLKYRRAFKALNTYLKGYFSEDRCDTDGRLRGNFHQTGTKTGRLSSSDPNLQNLTKAVPEEDPAYEDMKDIKIKKVIKAQPGWKIMQADLSQAEMRTVTCASKEPALIYSYGNGIDLHSMNAKGAFSIKKDLSKIIKRAIANGLVMDSEEYNLFVLREELQLIKEENHEQRDASKSISFGILYCMTAKGLKFDLDKKTRRKGRVWSVEECQDAINNFKKSYPQLARYLEYLKEFAKKNGYVKNLFGRRRWLPNIHSKDWKLRGKDLNAAVNTPIQGGSADIMLCGIIGIYNELDRTKAKLIMTVHDSLVIEVREDYVDECAAIVRRNLQNPQFCGKPLPFLCIPIVCDIEVGDCYGGLSAYKAPKAA